MPRLWCSRSCWRVCRPSVKLVSSTSSNLRSSARSKGRPETKSTLSMAAPISTAICSSGDKFGRTFPFCCVTCFCIVRRLYHSSTTKCICRLVSIGAYQTVGAIVPCRQRLCLCYISFAGFAHGAFPAEMPHAQNLQKIFPVAEGDHAQGPSSSVERKYCPHGLRSPVVTFLHLILARKLQALCVTMCYCVSLYSILA